MFFCRSYHLVPPEVLFNDGSPFGNIDDLRSFPEAWNKHNLESASVQRLINSTNLHFDVIINEEFFGDSLLMFAHKFNYAPTVTICEFNNNDGFSILFLSNNKNNNTILCSHQGPLGHPLFIDLQNGLLPALSVTSHIFLPYSDEMTFSQRWYNVIVSVYDWYVRKYGYLTTEEEYAQKYFGHLGPLPSLTDLIRNVSLVLVNTHRAIFPPRATLPSMFILKNIFQVAYILWTNFILWRLLTWNPISFRCHWYWRSAHQTTKTTTKRHPNIFGWSKTRCYLFLTWYNRASI